jgi:hypothetical protein
MDWSEKCRFMTENSEASVIFTARTVPVAAGLAWQDRALWLWLYPLLVLPSLAGTLLDSSDTTTLILLKAVERLVEMVCLFIIGRKILAVLASQELRPSTGALVRLASVGFGLWIAINLPFAWVSMISVQGPRHLTELIPLVLAMTLGVLGYIYFFYFFPLLLGLRQWRMVLSMARSFTRKDPLLPIKVSVGPLAIMYLGEASIRMISPDLRYLGVALASNLVDGLGWWLSCYTSTTAALLLLPDSDWRQLNLEPYRASRLTTLALQANPVLARLLQPRSALIMLVLSAVISAGNYARLAELPSSAEVHVRSVKIEEKSLSLTLELADPEYRFRGFQPLRFRLAGPERKVVAAFPSKAHLEGGTEDALISLPHSEAKLVLILDFVVDRPANELALLEDLYLWYGGQRLMLLDLKSGQTGP